MKKMLISTLLLIAMLLLLPIFVLIVMPLSLLLTAALTPAQLRDHINAITLGGDILGGAILYKKLKTISCRTNEMAEEGYSFAILFRRVINFLAMDNRHCEESC